MTKTQILQLILEFTGFLILFLVDWKIGLGVFIIVVSLNIDIVALSKAIKDLKDE